MSEEDIKTLKAALQKQRSAGVQDVGLIQVGYRGGQGHC